LSFYAFLKEWLPPSRPINCQKSKFSLVLKKHLGALAISLGCFPFDLESYTQGLTILLANAAFIFLDNKNSKFLNKLIRSFSKVGEKNFPRFLKLSLPSL